MSSSYRHVLLRASLRGLSCRHSALTRSLTRQTIAVPRHYGRHPAAMLSTSAAQQVSGHDDWTPPKDPWDLTDVLESSTIGYEQLPEFDAQYVSRTSQERVQLFQSTSEPTRTVPTLPELASMTLPPLDPSVNETNQKLYALQRKRRHYQYIVQRVVPLAAARVDAIRALSDWHEKQEAVDILFEDIQAELQAQEEILGKHPSFGKWVERALEEYLQTVDKQQKQGASAPTETGIGTNQQDATALPIFIDCRDREAASDAGAVVPKILNPLQPKARNQSVGKMVEEWELSANPATKRIMMRLSTREIARAITGKDAAQRVFVHGAQGVGKSAALATVVACARTSGAIVLYLPNGDDLCKNGFYLEPNVKQPGLFDLPVLTKQVCADLLASHQDALNDIAVPKQLLEGLCTRKQLEDLIGDKDKVAAADLLKHGSSSVNHASVAYTAVVESLMDQNQVDFFIVLDEFNCFFEKGHYYHGSYEDANKPVPYDQISLFRPALKAMSVTDKDDDGLADARQRNSPRLMKRGGIVVATTESHAVARKTTDALTANAKTQQYPASESANNENPTSNLHLVKVPHFSALEVEHVLANFEATGVGKLRLDRGETVMNEQEVARLRMVSGGIGQRLLDACIM